MSFTPIHISRPKSVRDTLSGQFVVAGPHKTADVLVGAGVSKRMMTDTELKHRKKLQAGIATTTSTLGLSALALKGGAVARSGGKVGRLLKIKPNAVHAAKLDKTALNTGIVSGGIGGLGGYNFASYTRAEGKKRQPLGKAADWQNISEHERRARDSRRTRERGKSMAGIGLATATGAPVARELFHPQSAPIGHQVRNVARNVRARTRVGRTIANNPYGAAALGGVGLMAAGGATMAGARINEKRHDVAIARHRKKRARLAKNYRGGIVDFGLDGIVQGEAGRFEEISKLRMPSIKLGDASKMTVKGKVIHPPSTAVARPKQPMSTRKKILIGGGVLTATGAGAGTYQLSKAYDPERSRQRRTSGYQAATMFGAGAAGAGAVHHGIKAGKAGREYHHAASMPHIPTSAKMPAGEARTALGRSEGARVGAARALSTAVKHGGKSVALGAGATGLAVASHRIGQYRKGRGRSYTPMRSIGY